MPGQSHVQGSLYDPGMNQSACVVVAQVLPVYLVILAVRGGLLEASRSQREDEMMADPSGWTAAFPPEGWVHLLAWMMGYEKGGRAVVYMAGVVEMIVILGANRSDGLSGNWFVTAVGICIWIYVGVALLYSSIDLAQRAFPDRPKWGQLP